MTNLKWKRKLGQFWPRQVNGRKTILLYHSLGNSPWAMPIKNFHEQINWLADHCQVLSLSNLISQKETGELQVAITFDDGYQSLHDEAAAILAEKGLNATAYLNTGWISAESVRKKSDNTLGHYPNESFLTWDEVKNLSKAGWLIGSHGVNHHNFSIIDSHLTLNELVESKAQIEMHLGTHCQHFAYPFGRYSKIVRQIVKAAGYQYAAAARHGHFNAKSDLLAFPRINIEKHYSYKDFQQIMQGKWDYLNLIHKLKGL